MRIISGTLKGKSINFIKNINTRPLKDSVRENIFNILSHSNKIKINVGDSKILDLYSGIGSFGVEAISRGANKIIFVEQNITASNILKENLIKLSISNKSNVYNEKIEKYLLSNIVHKFNIFFLDPPFSDFDFLKNLKLIKEKEIYHKNHIIIIHREKSTTDNFEGLLDVILTKQYGRSKIIFGSFN